MEAHIVLHALLLFAALLAANALFVTAEFLLLSRQRALPEPEQATPRRILAPRRLEEMLLVAQLASSAATLLLGFVVARAALLAFGGGPLGATGAVAVATAVAALAHALLGEQIPKLFAVLGLPEWAVRLILAPVSFLALVLRPITLPLAGGVSGLARNLGVVAPGLEPLLPTPDEIRLLVAQGHEQGVVEEDEREMIRGIFEFSETVAREVMTPRIDIVGAPTDIALGALVELIVAEGHSRLPVYEGTIDTVVGVLLAKDLIPLLADPQRLAEGFDVRSIMREPYFVPDTKPVDDILAEFRQLSVHLAIVLDEFGGTYGLVTMEDLLEEIVGEINDEYDVAEPEEFAATPEGDVLIDGGVSISEVNERFGLALPEEDFDTVGGFVFGALGRVPVPGDEVGALGSEQMLVLHVEETEDRRVTRVRLTHAAPVGETAGESAGGA